jgi:CMP-N,N'-diacetyllegionaminic acid synthase
MSRLCTICARGGSKGVPGKNVRELAGIPLIAHSIRQAQATKLFDYVVVSTDSDEIASAARSAGAETPFMRPAALATDTSPKLPVIRHALTASEHHYGCRFDVVVDLDATSPLRLAADIAACVTSLEESPNAHNVITGTPSRHSPYFNMVERREGRVTLVKQLRAPVTRRQDAPRTYDMNASIYVWRRAALLMEGPLITDTTLLHEMPAERSIDVDSELDWVIVEKLMMERGGC